MPDESPLADEAAAEIGALKAKGRASGWEQSDIDALLRTFDRWLQHPRLLDPEDESLLRVTILNGLTWLISEPVVGEQAWEHIRGIAKLLGRDDPHELRESWRIATFELAAQPPWMSYTTVLRIVTLKEIARPALRVLPVGHIFRWIDGPTGLHPKARGCRQRRLPRGDPSDGSYLEEVADG